MPALTSIALGGAALAGGLAGAGGEESTTTRVLPRQSKFEAELAAGQAGQFRDLQSILEGGFSTAQATQAQTNLADLLREFSRTGGLPGAQDIQQSQQLAQRLAAPQLLAQQQQFERQQTQFGRQAALMGRTTTDPVLANQLARSQFQQSSLLQSQIGARGEELAQQQPLRRLQFTQGLAEQAQRNRLTALSLGQQLLGAERQFRVAQAGEQTESGGGFGGFVSGALGGFGAVAKGMGGFG